MLGHEPRLVAIKIWAWIEIEMHQIDIIRYLFLQCLPWVERKNSCKRAVRVTGCQKTDFVPFQDQVFGKIPNHTLGAAIGKDRDW